MIRILLIRHGSTDLLGKVLYGRMPGVELNEAGKRESQRTGEGIRERYRLSRVVSSPLERAIETAARIAEPHGLTVTVDEGLTEVDFGLWMGKPFAELGESAEWKRYNEHRSLACPPAGEFLMQVQARAWAALERIAEEMNEEEMTVAVVSHGDVIRGLLLLLLGMPVDHIHRLEIAPASVSEVILRSGPPRVVTINLTF